MADDADRKSKGKYRICEPASLFYVFLGTVIGLTALWGALSVKYKKGATMAAFFTAGCVAAMVYGRKELRKDWEYIEK